MASKFLRAVYTVLYFVTESTSGCFDNKLFICLNHVFTITCHRSDGHIDIQARSVLAFKPRLNFLQDKAFVRRWDTFSASSISGFRLTFSVASWNKTRAQQSVVLVPDADDLFFHVHVHVHQMLQIQIQLVSLFRSDWRRIVFVLAFWMV